MSVRGICVQYLGSVLRLPVAIEDADLAKAMRLPFGRPMIPFGRPVLEREVEKVVLTQPDGREQVFVPERTCKWCKDGKTFDGQTVMMTNHGWQRIRHCPECGARIGRDR